MATTTKKRGTSSKARVNDGITLEVKELPDINYGDRGNRYPYEEAAAKLTAAAKSYRKADGERPWLSLRTGPRKRMDQFVTRVRKNIIPSDGWVLDVRTRQNPGQSGIPYPNREAEVFARLIPAE